MATTTTCTLRCLLLASLPRTPEPTLVHRSFRISSKVLSALHASLIPNASRDCATSHSARPFFPLLSRDTPPEAKKLGYNASSFAFTNNVPVFMQLADVVVCKPGAQPQSNTALIA